MADERDVRTQPRDAFIYVLEWLQVGQVHHREERLFHGVGVVFVFAMVASMPIAFFGSIAQLANSLTDRSPLQTFPALLVVAVVALIYFVAATAAFYRAGPDDLMLDRFCLSCHWYDILNNLRRRTSDERD